MLPLSLKTIYYKINEISGSRGGEYENDSASVRITCKRYNFAIKKAFILPFEARNSIK
jgi:hypothetical protein